MKLIILSIGLVTVFTAIIITDVVIRRLRKKIHKDIEKQKDLIKDEIQRYQKTSDEIKQVKNQINKIK